MISLSKTNITTGFLQASVLVSMALPHSVMAATCNADATAGDINEAAKCSQAKSQVNTLFGDGGIFGIISNILIFLVGAISVLMLIYGGLQYVISAGDKTRVEGAKNTILYAIIGIVVALLAYAAVTFVTTSLTSGNTAG